jgi:hypothetical protein
MKAGDGSAIVISHDEGNASPAMNSTFRARIIERTGVALTISDSIRFRCESRSKEIEESLRQEEKHFEQSTSTLFGMRMDPKVDPENVFDSIRTSSQSSSNTTLESERQQAKHDADRIRTWRGMTMDRKDEGQNALDSMTVSKESSSNLTDEIEPHQEKQEWQRISILRETIREASRPRYRINLLASKLRMKSP